MYCNRKRSSRNGLLFLGSFFTLLMTVPCVAQDEPENAWPREIEAASGVLVTVFQPQVDALEGDILKSRAAVMIRESDGAEPVFGAVWLETRISTDFDTRMVHFEALEVPRVRFPDATEEQEQDLIEFLKIF